MCYCAAVYEFRQWSGSYLEIDLHVFCWEAPALDNTKIKRRIFGHVLIEGAVNPIIPLGCPSAVLKIVLLSPPPQLSFLHLMAPPTRDGAQAALQSCARVASPVVGLWVTLTAERVRWTFPWRALSM